jgi:V/A-type H+/Na+-transporting ATPase subunit D
MRTPPGRLGRQWLIRRIETGRRGRDVLEQKRRALLRHRARLEAELGEAREEWEHAVSKAERRWQLAAVLGGERSLELALAAPIQAATVRVGWRNALGVVHPVEVEVNVPESGPPVAGSVALAQAAMAYRRALTSAARYAVARTAWERLSTELEATSHRLRAIERRWIPDHERALAELELALDESERSEIVQIRWFRDRLPQARLTAQAKPAE